eukprot:NODE_7687_length_426_cov_177.557951.p3 GENE.NODE_7687_length_426_cov_177.557951~~NODE_7687_length_426_cov_177.557951.p3  ORF type:complete len:71 (-),score=17.76 NODE_7687_length_426_cov_177.557951:141-353(-)
MQAQAMQQVYAQDLRNTVEHLSDQVVELEGQVAELKEWKDAASEKLDTLRQLNRNLVESCSSLPPNAPQP